MASRLEIEDSLRRCRPLEDPVALWSKSLPWTFAASILYASVLVGIQLVAPDPGFLEGAPDFLTSLIAMAAMGYALWVVNLLSISGYFAMRPLLRLSKKEKVLFLRSFSRDREPEADRTLRKLLRAALPAKYQLAGIRPPEMRVSGPLRVLAEGLTALRYLGSNYFELEAADRNWFARLLATASESHAVIIDIRETTPFVHHEMKLAANFAAQRGRLFLIVDGSRSLDEWEARFRDVTQWKESQALELLFLQLPSSLKPEPSAFTAELVSQFDMIPGSQMGADIETWKFARKQVKDEHWATPFRETAAFSFLCVTIPLSVAVACASPFLPHVVVSLIVGIISLIALGYFGTALVRMFRSARLSKRIGRKPRPSAAGIVWSLLPAVVATSANILVTDILLQKKTREAKMRTTENVLLQMNSALQQHWLEMAELPQPHGDYRSDSPHGEALMETLRSYSVDLSDYRPGDARPGFVDPFGSPFQIRIKADGFTLQSAGADAIFGTEDDLRVEE